MPMSRNGEYLRPSSPMFQALTNGISLQSRYVHTGCLEAWRKAAPNERAFWECQQCGYQYRLRRTSLARLVTSPRAPKLRT